MFTGIIIGTGKVIAIAEGNKSRRVTLSTDINIASLQIGASVACDGCCLTLVEKSRDTLTFDVAAETMALTTLKNWDIDTLINIETSLRLGDELGGHMVSGHVDGVALVESVRPDGDSWRFEIRVPDYLARYISPKGSVALNGISLTVNEVEGSVFGVCIIPHTWKVTNIHLWDEGTQINLEVDQLARYVARILGRDAA
ncbi:MAG: riboflavin synthase [Micavibrio aeruginosavorus]|uniref:Riboflavin synthase n=1 Tax=Micavibrio aeruginosavorus TaxID=349221 RepID=A0A7T5R1A3_9BACT|nr:MAG: riboflavin synthase [Micavibrio aeruginosavorus]